LVKNIYTNTRKLSPMKGQMLKKQHKS